MVACSQLLYSTFGRGRDFDHLIIIFKKLLRELFLIACPKFFIWWEANNKRREFTELQVAATFCQTAN